LDKIPNIKVIYPKNLFGYTEEPTEIIILTDNGKLMRGVIKKQDNIVSFNIEEVDPKEVKINYKEDINNLDKVFFGLNFSTNASSIKCFINNGQK
jgi:hypothetical protein